MSFRWLKLDERSLSQQWIFRLVIAIPFAISFLLCVPLWFETTFDFSSAGYTKFLSIFSLPIGVLSLSIPLVAIVAHIHRTIQTEKQIKLTDQKNISDRFYSHYKYIIDSFSSIETENIKINGNISKIKISNINSLYRCFFPNSSPENGVILNKRIEHAKKISFFFEEIDKEIKELEEQESNPEIILCNIIMNITLLSAFLKLNLYEIVSNTNNRGLLFTVNDVQYKIATCFLDEDELKCYLKNLYSMNITIMNLLDINFDYYPRLSNYAFSSEKYLLSSSFKKMKSTRERFDSFRTGKKVFTENEFDDFNATFDSYITQ